MKSPRQMKMLQLQVGDLIIASPEQVPLLEPGPFPAGFGAAVNFLRSGCPGVQIADLVGSLEEGDRNREELVAKLNLIALPGEKFHVSQTEYDEETHYGAVTVTRTFEKNKPFRAEKL